MRRRVLITLTCTLLLAGCGFFSRTKSRFFSLDPVPPASAATAATGLPVGIDTVVLPPGLDRKEVVVRKDDQQLEIRERDQWAATLQSMVLHTLAFDLAGRLPEGMVILPGQAKPVSGMRAIDVVFEELAANGNVLVLDARWTLQEPLPARIAEARREQLEVPLSSTDSAEIARATSVALGQLADRIAAGMR